MKENRELLKKKVINLRKRGLSIKEINKKTDVPLSTISGWVKKILLTKKQTKVLNQNWKDGLTRARKKAVTWHNKQKLIREMKAKEEARETISRINTTNKDILELVLSFLYLGEGAKKDTFTIANSNPNIILFYLSALEKVYDIKRTNLTYHLHLRADQNESSIKIFWKKILNIPIKNITYCVFDQRTKGKKTYSNYHGVCVVNGGGIQTQRRLLEISKLYSNMTIQEKA